MDLSNKNPSSGALQQECNKDTSVFNTEGVKFNMQLAKQTGRRLIGRLAYAPPYAAPAIGDFRWLRTLNVEPAASRLVHALPK